MGKTKDPAVDELARQVRALKERSGRSYGSLARRLNVSTSTLFRYCSGETVPERFTVLDQLARLCGATEDERRALRQAWTRADEVRRPPVPPAMPLRMPAPEPVPPPTAPTGTPRPHRRPARAAAAAVAALA
ncbi:helix-turn-helix transcriptional regulator, partial [Streptomyces sp. NPDC047981]|uniref:helix-turn-helix domain-containing protein n=1 Tax=Streptomyces sp. NPDC047981 TaxID=3154610 RepID=UPI0034209BAF